MQNDAPVALILFPALFSIFAFSAVVFFEAVFYLYLSDFIIKRFSIGVVLAYGFSLFAVGAVFSIILGLVSEYRFLGFFFSVLILCSEIINYFLSGRGKKLESSTDKSLG